MKNSLPCSFWCKCSIDCSNKSLLFDDSKEADILFFDLKTTGLSSDAKIIELSFFYPAVMNSGFHLNVVQSVTVKLPGWKTDSQRVV